MNLNPPYDNPLEQRMADLASTTHILDPDPYEDDGEGLFALLVRGVYIYVEAWSKADDDSSLGALFVATDDLADPSRAGDPNATFVTLLQLALEAIHDNIRCELDPDYGRWIPPDGSA